MDCSNWLLGVDEAWRGPLAWPVMVGGVFVLPEFWSSPPLWSEDIGDSKQLSAWQREQLYQAIISDDRIVWSVASSSAHTIDRKGIVWALHSASKRVLDDILRQIHSLPLLSKSTIVIDGNHDFWLHQIFFRRDGALRQSWSHPWRSSIQSLATLTKGDQKLWHIAAASILAKVSRDCYMIALSHRKNYRHYDFSRHKGYGTAQHRALIAKYGLSDIHRESFCQRHLVMNN